MAPESSTLKIIIKIFFTFIKNIKQHIFFGLQFYFCVILYITHRWRGYVHVEYKAVRALRVHLLFQLWTFPLCLCYKTKTKQKNRGFNKNNCCWFFKLIKNRIYLEVNFWILIIHNLPWGHVRSNTKFGPDRFSCLFVCWIQTNKQTPRQAKYIYVKVLYNLTFIFSVLFSSDHLENYEMSSLIYQLNETT